MTPRVRRFVWFGGLLLAGAFFWDVRNHKSATQPAAPPKTSAFVQEVSGFGEIQTSITGHVEFLAGRMSNQSGAAEILVEGEDPVFGEGEVVLKSAVVRQIDFDNGILLYEAHSEVARIALEPGNGGLVPDRSRPWILEEAEVTWSPQESGFRLETASLQIHTQDPPWMETDAPVWIQGGGIRVAGWGIRLYPAEERFELGPGNTVEWEWQNQGSFWKGEGEGPVRLEKTAVDIAVLQIPQSSKCQMTLPDTSGWPGTLRSKGIQVQLALKNGNWEPKRASLGAPCRWTGALAAPEGMETLQGAACSLRWLSGGALDQVEWAGPVAMVGSIPDTTGALTPASATSGSVVMRGNGGAVLKGGVQGKTASGNFSAQSGKMESDGHFRLEGKVSLEDGRAQSELFLRQPDGSLRLEGRAILRPEDGFQIAAESVVRHRDGWLRASGNPRATRQVEGFPTMLLTAGTMEWRPSWRRTGHSSIHAWDAVRLEREGAVFRGNDLRWVPDIRTEMVGKPASVIFPAGQDFINLSARRFLWEQEIFVADGKPALDFPAASLELSGDRIQVAAERMHWQQGNGQWEILGSVAISGALEGIMRRIAGDPNQIELQPPSGRLCHLRGWLADGQEFSVSALVMLVQKNRLHLKKEASARFPLAAGGEFFISGREGEISANEGWFSKDVSVQGEGFLGRADFSSWSRDGSSLDTLRLDGSAHLKRSDASVSGEEILFQPQEEQVTVCGVPNKPAKAVLADGRIAEGDFIQVDLRLHLLSGIRGGVRQP